MISIMCYEKLMIVFFIILFLIISNYFLNLFIYFIIRRLRLIVIINYILKFKIFYILYKLFMKYKFRIQNYKKYFKFIIFKFKF